MIDDFFNLISFHNRIKNKCKGAYLYVTTISSRIQTYLDPDCSSRARVLSHGYEIIPRFRRNRERNLDSWSLCSLHVQTGTQKLIQYWHKHGSKKALNFKSLKYFSGIWWCCTWMFFLRFNSFHTFWFARIFLKVSDNFTLGLLAEWDWKPSAS